MALVLLLVPGCDDGDPEAERIESSTYSVTTTALTAALVGAPMSGEAEDLYRDRDRASDDQARDRVETAIGGDMVADAACVAYAWTDLRATVTFTDCVSPRTGRTIDDTATLAVTLRPSTVFTFTFADLSIGGISFAGSITLEYTGAGAGPTSKITADLVFESAGEAAAVTLDDVVVDVVGGTYTLDGPGHVVTDTVDADFVVAGMVLAAGDCLPSAGTITLTIGEETVVVRFTADTPTTGAIVVTVGARPEATLSPFSPC
jgi:hypothetical protein